MSQALHFTLHVVHAELHMSRLKLPLLYEELHSSVVRGKLHVLLVNLDLLMRKMLEEHSATVVSCKQNAELLAIIPSTRIIILC